MTFKMNDPNSKLNDPSSKLGPEVERLCKHHIPREVAVQLSREQGGVSLMVAFCRALEHPKVDEGAVAVMRAGMASMGGNPGDSTQCMFGGRQPCPFFNWEPKP